MKKKLINTMFVVVMFITTVSCSKNNEAVFTTNGTGQDSEFVSQDTYNPTRAIDPSQVIASLAQEYGWVYDFDNIKIAHPSSASLISIYTVQSMWNSTIYLTIVLDSNANIIGLYDIQFPGLTNADNGYDYTVSYPYGNGQLFAGWIGINVAAPMPNHLYVYSSSLNVPSDYPYSIFANVTSGYVPLENYSYIEPTTNQIFGWKLAFHAASTFYVNFYE